MGPTLSGCELKLDRAYKQLTALNKDVGGFLKGGAYGVTVEFYADRELTKPFGDRLLVTLGQPFYGAVHMQIHRPAPVEWGVHIGDVLHNLRSALDHLAYQLAGTAASSTTEFPIFLKRKDFEKPRAQDKMLGFPTRAQALVTFLQPYRRGNPARLSHPLWVLHRLNNIDKHQVLHVVAAAMFDPNVHSVVLPGMVQDSIEVLRSGPVEPNAAIARIQVHIPAVPQDPGHQFGMDVHVQSPYGVAFDKTGPAMGRPVISTLEEILVFIRESVIPRFRFFF